MCQIFFGILNHPFEFRSVFMIVASICVEFSYSIDDTAAEDEASLDVDDISVVDEPPLVDEPSLVDEPLLVDVVSLDSVDISVDVSGIIGANGKHEVVLKQKFPSLPSFKNPKRLKFASDCCVSC